MAETERASAEVLSLPMHPFLSDADVDSVVVNIERFARA
jgi:dTDP-4-amino-4,6-dideoxygalactose transaminase